MALGDSTLAIQSGGAKQGSSAALVARAIVHLLVSPKGTPNTLYKVADQSAISALFDTGPLAELAALCVRTGQTLYAMPLNPSVAGGFSSAVAHPIGSGTGTIVPSVAPHKAITILCVLGGPLGTATFQFSLDGGVTYGPVVASVAGWASTGYMVPGTFITLTLGAATYVATKTNTVGVDGSIAPGSGWVGTVAILASASSPVDTSDVVVNVTKAGALGTAQLQISLDNGVSFLPSMLVPSGGILVIPKTGMYLTCALAFNLGDQYTYQAVTAGPASADITSAVTALRPLTTFQATLIHLGVMPSTAAGAFTAAATLEAALDLAFSSNGLDWQGAVNVPVAAGAVSGQLGDVVLSGVNAAIDVTDTTATVAAARSTDQNRVAMHAGSYYQTSSPMTSRFCRRPLSWFLCQRYVDTEPRQDPSEVDLGALNIFVPSNFVTQTGGRDELLDPGLDDVQINTARSYRNRGVGAYFSITSGGNGWKNISTDVFFGDAGGLRALNTGLPAVRAWQQGVLGQRPQVNADGTIAEIPARNMDTTVNNVFQKALCTDASGRPVPGADFTQPQASAVTAKVLRTSQLGNSPKRLDVAYTFARRGLISATSGVVSAS